VSEGAGTAGRGTASTCIERKLASVMRVGSESGVRSLCVRGVLESCFECVRDVLGMCVCEWITRTVIDAHATPPTPHM